MKWEGEAPAEPNGGRLIGAVSSFLLLERTVDDCAPGAALFGGFQPVC